MLPAVVRIALALEILLVCIEGVAPTITHHYLPLAGSHLAQLGFVLGLAVTIVEIRKSLKEGDTHDRPPTEQSGN
jgi:hypothetical protein